MKGVRLNPKDITQPIQLLGASLIGAVFLVGEFLYASLQIIETWIGIAYATTAILIFPIILGFIGVLQIKFRDQMQSDPFWHEGKKMEYEKEMNNKLKPFTY